VRKFAQFELKASETVTNYVCGGSYRDVVNIIVWLFLDEQLEFCELALRSLP
jgi:hypothetical protein